jgi:hypothetical protein
LSRHRIVTNLARPAEPIPAFYNQRGTAEQWIKEAKRAIKWTRLSWRSCAVRVVKRSSDRAPERDVVIERRQRVWHTASGRRWTVGR